MKRVIELDPSYPRGQEIMSALLFALLIRLTVLCQGEAAEEARSETGGDEDRSNGKA
jgi:hypothetical protein